MRDANHVLNISKFMDSGGNFKTASSLWRFIFLYRYGGWYADTDAVALKEWPDQTWVICGESPGKLSTGVIRAPMQQKMFLSMANNIKFDWGNVDVFNEHYIMHMGNNKETIDSRQFYPLEWKNWALLLAILDIPNVYSIHLYHTMFERSGMIKDIEEYITKNPDAMISKICRML